jgi:hypothetical protein
MLSSQIIIIPLAHLKLPFSLHLQERPLVKIKNMSLKKEMIVDGLVRRKSVVNSTVSIPTSLKIALKSVGSAVRMMLNSRLPLQRIAAGYGIQRLRVSLLIVSALFKMSRMRVLLDVIYAQLVMRVVKMMMHLL